METYLFILSTPQNNALYFVLGFAICVLIVGAIYKLKNRNQIEIDGCKCELLRQKEVISNQKSIKALPLVDKQRVFDLESGEKMIYTLGNKQIMVARLYVSPIQHPNRPFEYLYWEIKN